MKKRVYVKPNAKLHVPKFELLIPIGQGNNSNPIEVKGNNSFDDTQENMWGKVWGRSDD